jgi:hypothetical protein
LRKIAKRRINELNRELLTSETEYEKNLFKTRIARLSGYIAKVKLVFQTDIKLKNNVKS